MSRRPRASRRHRPRRVYHHEPGVRVGRGAFPRSTGPAGDAPWPREVAGTGHARDMRFALAYRTIFIAVWLSALLGNGPREAAAVISAVALLTVWVAALVRDGRSRRS